MFMLQENSRKNIEKVVGLSVKKISRMGACRFDLVMEKKLGKKLRVTSAPNKHLSSRGSPLISMGRLSQTETIDTKIEKIVG